MKEKKIDNEKVKIILSAIGPLVAVLVMFMVKFYESVSGLLLSDYGLFPLKLNGLLGVFTMPFLHENWSHLWSNVVPFFIIGTAICYYYKNKSWGIFFYFLIFTGLFTWLIGRESYHIGASGLVYAMSFFILISALIKKEKKLMSFALLVIFLYGSIIWGFFPEFFPNQNISWEGHLSGAISGIIVAFIYRDYGPEKLIYKWEDDEDNEVDAGVSNIEIEDKSNNDNEEKNPQMNFGYFQNHT